MTPKANRRVLTPEYRARDGPAPLVPLVLTRIVGAAVVVVQVCPRAQALGLRSGLSLGQAQALAPQLRAVSYEPQYDQAVLRRLADWALRFSPIVEPVEPDTLLIDITGCQLLFGGEENIARQAARGLAEQGFSVRAAIADTVGAAYALATTGRDSLSIVPLGQTSARLAPLPPRALRIAPQVAEQLDTLGVRTIGDLLMLPRATLPARFGPQLGQRLQQALGEAFEGLTPHQPEEVPRASWRFEAAVADAAIIERVAERLLGDVLAQVHHRGLVLRRLECVLYYEQVAPRVVSVGLARATRARAHIARLLAQRLELVDVTPGVLGVALVARETSRWCAQQGELFEPREPGDDEALGSLIDRLVARLGYDAVVRPRLVDDHQPEAAFRMVSVAEAGCEVEESTGAGRPGRLLRPVRLLPRPILIRAIALVPDGPPTWFSYQGREHVLAGAAGPERIETAWWRGADVRRDYFRVTTEAGEQFWIFHARPDGPWYLHGVFT